MLSPVPSLEFSPRRGPSDETEIHSTSLHADYDSVPPEYVQKLDEIFMNIYGKLLWWVSLLRFADKSARVFMERSRES
jgi:hypothetical protein